MSYPSCGDGAACSLLMWSSLVAPVPLLGLSLAFEGTARWQNAAFASTVALFTLLVPVVGILTARLVRGGAPDVGRAARVSYRLGRPRLALGVVDALEVPRRTPAHAVTPISYDSDMDNTALLEAFEAGEIAGDEFPHRSHVRVAWELSRRYEPEEGLRRLIAGIQGIAARAGRPTVYHKTTTRAWFELVSSADDLAEHPELFDKTLLSRYYSPGRLDAGRERWLEPDLHPLTLPPPAPVERNGLAFLEVMRHVPVPVAVLATRAQGTVHAATVSSLASVSREPALISVIDHAAAWLGCELHAAHQCGDHHIVSDT